MKFHYKMPSPIGFQLAPMLDIVFLLLVFFIVTQTFEDDEPDLSINLPSAETPKPGENVSNEIIVNIRKDGTVVINRQPYTMPQLEDKLFPSPGWTKPCSSVSAWMRRRNPAWWCM